MNMKYEIIHKVYDHIYEAKIILKNPIIYNIYCTSLWHNRSMVPCRASAPIAAVGQVHSTKQNSRHAAVMKMTILGIM